MLIITGLIQISQEQVVVVVMAPDETLWNHKVEYRTVVLQNLTKPHRDTLLSYISRKDVYKSWKRD